MRQYCIRLAFALTLATAGLFGSAGAALATVFTLSGLSIAGNTGSGLIINTAPSLGLPASADLTLGVPQTVGLFQIWTPEGRASGDDLNGKPFTVTMSFSAPAPAFGSGSLGGQTDAFSFIVTGGELIWDKPFYDVPFGALGDGILRIGLSDEVFNLGLFGLLTPGQAFGATVDATFTMVRAATVPEPATLALLGAGLLGLAVARRRAAAT